MNNTLKTYVHLLFTKFPGKIETILYNEPEFLSFKLLAHGVAYQRISLDIRETKDVDATAVLTLAIHLNLECGISSEIWPSAAERPV